VLQWDKDDCAAIGLVKFDLLGLGMLDALHRCVKQVQSFYDVTIDLGALAQEDAVYDLLCEADTVGVFQVESRAQMADAAAYPAAHVLRPRDRGGDHSPRSDPGQRRQPLHPTSSRRRTGHVPAPAPRAILRRTLGVPLFQEQLMEMASRSPASRRPRPTNYARPMAAKRSELRMMKLKSRFYSAWPRTASPERRPINSRRVAAFSNFGFPESHAVSFAHLVYCSAWLKVHYPAAFLVSMLNAQPLGFWSSQSLVADAQRHGVRVRRPDVTARAPRFTRGRPDDPDVRLGLGDLRTIGDELRRAS